MFVIPYGLFVIFSCVIVSRMPPCSILSISHMSLSLLPALFYPDPCRLPVIITTVSGDSRCQTQGRYMYYVPVSDKLGLATCIQYFTVSNEYHRTLYI